MKTTPHHVQDQPAMTTNLNDDFSMRIVAHAA